MISRNIEPSAIAYSRMIQLYLEHDQPENANQMFRRMRSNKMTVSVQTFTMLMEYMSKANDTRAALRYYQEMLDAGVQPDVNCYTTLINVQLRGKNVAGAERAYENMMKAGVSPTIYTYMSMMRVYSLQGHLDKVKGQWEAMAEAGIVPDLKAYTLLMQSYGQTGNAEMAEFIYKMMTQKDVVPDIITFTSLLGAYANLPHLSVSRVEEITRTVKDMELDPTPEYFKLLFDMYGRHRMPDKVIRTWNEFQKLSKPLEWVPTTSNSLHLIEACRERGYIDTLHVVWQRITTGRQKNNDDSSNGGIDGDGSGDSIGVGDGGVTNSLPPDVKIMPEVFSAYLNTLLTHNRFGEIEKLLQTECKELQIVPRTQDFELLFTGLAQFGFLENELKSVRGVVIGAWPSVQPLVDNIISNTRKI
ncbi:hypothetical protein BGZ94_007335 [Podila epigama]|nr:hypothetical protein BGZ94_007335 [Podila epigama]